MGKIQAKLREARESLQDLDQEAADKARTLLEEVRAKVQEALDLLSIENMPVGPSGRPFLDRAKLAKLLREALEE